MSDARKIKGVRPIENALRKLLRLAPVEFRDSEEDRVFRGGFVAQQLQKVFPEQVIKSKDNDNGTDPLPAPPTPLGRAGWFVDSLDALVPYVIAAVIEIATRLDEVEQTVKQRTRKVDKRLDDLESRVATLENR